MSSTPTCPPAPRKPRFSATRTLHLLVSRPHPPSSPSFRIAKQTRGPSRFSQVLEGLKNAAELERCDRNTDH
ncbi:unnamed protein product [Zymoseptoria tritici ST99CH_1A5]|uniref:Uncharacterized protein n=1 Tax=Zymoseptoria tritici ST99CH_1A5 TaxID=1276529 RepID=A0A1Y6M1V4_ZYMTR|nr:unnamed protein product [Zymoseptoria tritici ST99CH_3D1]SMY30572.1 unnamed protein product [Zymoseptoria tritici ST99CH_1A5]